MSKKMEGKTFFGVVAVAFFALLLFMFCGGDSNPTGSWSGGPGETTTGGGLVLGAGEAWIESGTGMVGFVFMDDGKYFPILSTDGTNWITIPDPLDYTVSGNRLTTEPETMLETVYTFSITGIGGSTLQLTVVSVGGVEAPAGVPPMAYEKRTDISIAGIGPYTLTINVVPANNSGGSVTRTPSLMVYNHGAVVNLEAVPAVSAGYTFDGWSGALTSGNRVDSITMNDNLTLTATFRPFTESDYHYDSYCDLGPISGDQGGCIRINKGHWEGPPCDLQGGTVVGHYNNCSPGSLSGFYCDYGFNNCQPIRALADCNPEHGVAKIGSCSAAGGIYCDYGQPGQWGRGGCFFNTGTACDQHSTAVSLTQCVSSNTSNPCIADPYEPGAWGGSGLFCNQ
ncbi:MAG: InlB B-repeat-containing protein [Chitinispirillales bacterium]|jgi:uncharacterized repeat protein (TIGR02543 family)|nr:InlB B-repeat-containing protein [Chitinispirillales bacterium]